eukprot:TRINITY_DN56751_c0_g1_i1.p1 TRINITY_DN56751_c0_g1~~TRINITY_DN56751_c0_g1_i1.p1  ORF type:complete len:345 (+),score=97.38 TRINITY_DN56751_c0_g1_i1:97-1131(+)
MPNGVELPPLPLHALKSGGGGGNGFYLYGMHKLNSSRGATSRRRKRQQDPSYPGPYDSPRRQLLLDGEDRGPFSPTRMQAHTARLPSVDAVATREFGDCFASQRIHAELGRERYSAPFLAYFPEPFNFERVDQELPKRVRFNPEADPDEYPPSLTYVHQTLCGAATEDGKLTRAAWVKCLREELGVEDVDLLDRLFTIFDRSDAGVIGVRTVMKTITALMKGPHGEKVYEESFGLFAESYPIELTEDGIIKKKKLTAMRDARSERKGQRQQLLTLLACFNRKETDRPDLMTYQEFRKLLTDPVTGPKALPPFLTVLLRVLEKQYRDSKQREERKMRTGGRTDAK